MARAYAKVRLDGLPDHLNVLGARVTALAAKSTAEYIQSPHAVWGGVQKRFEDISGRLRHELTLAKVLTIEVEKHNFFEPSAPLFGPEFEAKFIRLLLIWTKLRNALRWADLRPVFFI